MHQHGNDRHAAQSADSERRLLLVLGMALAYLCAEVIGGVLLTGGAGSVIGIVLGTMTFAIVNQGIFFSGLDPNFGSIIIGGLLLAAVLSNDTFRAMALSYVAKKK